MDEELEKNEILEPEPSSLSNEALQNEKDHTLISLELYPLEESERLLNSPRSLEACRQEGILPEELLYKDPKHFAIRGQPPEVQKLRYFRSEKKRRELLEIVINARKQLIQSLELASTMYPKSQQSHRKLVASESLEGSKSGIMMESVISPSTRMNYEKIVSKAKQRELSLMNKMLAVEEQKNLKYDEQEKHRIMQEEKLRAEQLRKEKKMKRVQQRKLKAQMEKEQFRLEEEKQKRLEAQQRAHEELEMKEFQQEQERMQEKERIELMKKKEKKRKEKAEKAMLMRKQEILKQENKIIMMKKKMDERTKMIQKHKKEQAQLAEERRQQFELIKQRVQENIDIEEQNKMKEFIQRQKKKQIQEEKVKLRSQQKLEELKERAESRNIAIRRAINESQKITENRKQNILSKQQIAEKRLQEMKKRKKIEEEIRNQDFLSRTEIKKMNAERKRRKELFKIQKIKEKMMFEEMKKNAWIQEREGFKNMRVANQTQASLQREYIQSALRSMAVWNVWDMDVVKNIIVEPSRMQYQTIDNIVRLRSGLASRSKRTLGETQSFAMKNNEEEEKSISQNQKEMYKSLNKTQPVEELHSPQTNPKDTAQNNGSSQKPVQNPEASQPGEEMDFSEKPSPSSKDNSNKMEETFVHEETPEEILPPEPQNDSKEIEYYEEVESEAVPPHKKEDKNNDEE